MMLENQNNVSKKKINHHLESSLEVQFIPLLTELKLAWRAGLLSLLNILKGKGPDEFDQEAPDRRADHP
jgi:hypothetical protein